MKKIIAFVFLIALLPSCEVLQVLLTQTAATVPTVSTADQIAGLKEALNLGITKTVGSVSRENGYYSDALLKILLPEETNLLVENIRLVPGGQTLVDNAILRLNRAAEDAASEALPIFVNAIRNVTITDAKNILFGADTAATAFLRKSTYAQLKSAFKPKIEASLNKDLVGSISATESWTTLTTSYNKVASSLVGQAAGLKPVQADLAGFVADEALQGLFLKVGQEEKNIRENPAARATELLQKVFGLLDR